MTHTITLRSWSSGDWQELLLDGAMLHRGHAIPNQIWLDLLRGFGAQIEQETVPSQGCGIPGCPCADSCGPLAD
jgi:hypothetical protein